MIKNTKISDRQKEKILGRCIELLRRGYSLEYCETKYKKYENVLKDYLPIIERVKKLKHEDLDDAFLKNTLNKIYNDSSVQDMYGVHNKYGEKSNRFHSILKPVMIFVAVVLIFSFSLMGILYASQSSLPNNVLYPVKRYGENVKLFITPESKKKILHFEFLNNRLNEATLFFSSSDKEKNKMEKLIKDAEDEFEHLKKYNYFGDYTEEEIKDSIEKIRKESINEFGLEDDEGGAIQENTSDTYNNTDNNDSVDNDHSEDNKNKQGDSEFNKSDTESDKKTDEQEKNDEAKSDEYQKTVSDLNIDYYR
ncbi:MAG: DUF5667 domain-containing protein [Actinobacteria bacterium]|nr:DUF5667 domain-containing protein [Actinomycetota bacterium]